MGIFRRKNPKWTDKTVLQSWIPMLMYMFTFDSDGNLTGTNSSCFSDDPCMCKGQLSTLTILLKGKTGVTSSLLSKLKALYIDTCRDCN